MRKTMAQGHIKKELLDPRLVQLQQGEGLESLSKQGHFKSSD